MLYRRKDSKFWWTRIKRFGRSYSESTKTTDKKAARKIDAQRRVDWALFDAGVERKLPAPRLGDFIDQKFLPYVKTTCARNTFVFYNNSCNALKANIGLVNLKLDQIELDQVARHAAARLAAGLTVSTANGDLIALRRIFHLAQEWRLVPNLLPKIKLIPGSAHRETVLSLAQCNLYLEHAPPLLRDVATVLIDMGLRPDECFRLQWEQVRDGGVEIFRGKGRGSRRRVPCTQRALAVLDARRDNKSPWVFPAPTKSGHIESSSVRKHHGATLKRSGLPPFVLYTFRHSAITRWSKVMDSFTLRTLAGHTDLRTTGLYAHVNDADVRAAFDKAAAASREG